MHALPPNVVTPTRLLPAWARVVGAGSIRRDFGHHVATNAAGEVLLAARLDRLDGGTAESTAGNEGAPASCPPDLTAGRLIKLAPGGGPAWSLLLRDAGLLRAPAVALDDAGAAYVAGPFVPDEAGLCGGREVTLTKLGPGGAVEWSRPLLLVRVQYGRPLVPVVDVAADPAGGACVSWVGERRGSPVVRALRLSNAGSIEWEYAWPVTGEVIAPRIGLDATGAAVVWGTFRGAVSFAPGDDVTSPVEARYLARVEPDGRVSWAHALRVEPDAPHAIALGRGGALAVATVVQAAARSGRERRRVLALLRLDASGAALKEVRGYFDPHTSIPSLCLSPVAGDTFALAGYFSGALSFGAVQLRGPTPASEAAFIASIDLEGDVSACVLPVPLLSGGLSVHGTGDGAILAAGWACGTMMLGGHKIASPPDRAVLFLANLARG